MTRAKDISKIITDANFSGTFDVAGTVTADDITLSDADTPTLTLTDTTNTLTTFLQSGNSTAILGTSTAHDIRFQANSNDAIRIANGGDISFYEDTGTTPKFFWDASAEALGIGLANPSSELTVGGNATTTYTPTVAITDTTSGATMAMRGQSPIIFFDCTSSGVGKILTDGQGLEIKDGTLDAEGNVDFKIDSAGHVTMPAQSAFLATKTANANNFTIGSQQDVTFTTEVYDQNADFASSTFTAPVTGKYYLKCSIYLSGVDTAVDYYAIRINTSNRVYIKIFTPKFTADVDFMSMEVSTVADMDASDTASIQIIQSSGTAQTDIQGNAAYTYFTGFLAC